MISFMKSLNVDLTHSLKINSHLCSLKLKHASLFHEHYFQEASTYSACTTNGRLILWAEYEGFFRKI